MPREAGVAKYYIVIGRHPEPKPGKERSELHIVGKPVPVGDHEEDMKELSKRIDHIYASILEGSLFKERSEARGMASFLEKRGYLDVEVYAVVPLKKFVGEPRLLADEPEK